MMNKVQAVAPWAALAVAFVFVLVLAFRWSKVRPVQRDARGDAPLLIIDGKIYDADRNPYPLVDLSGKKTQIPALTAPELQMATTARDQMIDLATRGGQRQANPQRKAIAQRMVAQNILSQPTQVRVLPPEQARPLLGDVIPGIVRDAISDATTYADNKTPGDEIPPQPTSILQSHPISPDESNIESSEVEPLSESVPTPTATATPTLTPDTPTLDTATPTPDSATPIPTPTLATATPAILANATIGEPAPALLQQAAYLYDGDGNMVRGTINGMVTYYPGRHYNKAVDGATVTAQKNYAFGAQTVAMRVNGTLHWVLGDHLGSTSVTANADGSFKSQVQYTAFGEIRASAGITETEYRYTGQLRQAEVGLYYYVARFYDPQLAHFTSADTIVPGAGSAKDFNRYAYTLYNPIRYNDPSGHDVGCAGRSMEECAPKPKPTSPPKTKKADWFIVCGIGYRCTGDQTGKHKTFGEPAYPGWQQFIESKEGNKVVFNPVPDAPPDFPFTNYSVSAYASAVTDAIQTSTADELYFLCHSRGGQVCTHLAKTVDDPRITAFFLLDPSIRSDVDQVPGVYDTETDYKDVVNDQNRKFQIILIVSHAQYIPSSNQRLVICGNLENESSKNVLSYFRTYAKFMESKQVGVLVRNASSLFDGSSNSQSTLRFPKIPEVCKAFEKAGSELATLGYIRYSTQKKASQEVIPVPFFGFLKRFRPIKQKVIEYLRNSST